MAVTDLTNTTWVLNNVLDVSGGLNYTINFISSNINFTSLSCFPDIRMSLLMYDDVTVGQGLGEFDTGGPNINTWDNEAYKTIEITGGTDATNASLISWLEANATQQAATPDVVVDLSEISALVAGTQYTVYATAYAEGYVESVASNTVVYEKQAPTPSGYELKLSSSATRSIADRGSCTLTTNSGTVCDLATATLGTTLATGVTSVTYTYVGGGGNTSYSMNGSTGSFTNNNQTLTLTGDLTITGISIWCLTGDMLITMADNTEKRMDKIQVGDKILSYNGNALEEAVVTYSDADAEKTHNNYDVWEFSDGTIVKTVHRHRLYNCESEAFVNMDEWKLGDHARTIDGKEIALVKHEHVDELVNHYTIFTDKYNNYFVNGLLAGNKYSAEITCND